MIAAAHLKRGLPGEQFARLGNPALGGKDRARKDQRLGPCPAFGKAAHHQQLIGALFWHG
jgi:hypothetical protein